jgi:hypothetical protein
MVKMPNKLGIEGIYLNLIKAIYNKPTSNIILNLEKIWKFSLPDLEQEKDAHFHHFCSL